MTDWDGEEYQRRIEQRLQGVDLHGEVAFVQRYAPRTVLDAGCGTGRVAIELTARGVEVVGVDVSGSMLSTARTRGPEVDWVEADLADLNLGRTFDVVVMAGNVVLFTPPGTTAAVVAGSARHVSPGGVLVAGFSLDRDYDLATYDAEAAAAGLTLRERYATWDRDPWREGADYAVSVHARGSA
ncbi:class I SAM-dependent methyltransferase [Egicoccus halophilus]|uniref:SAM-dependent methyltransferase n=1 Tax=Egicoccus halophilus TaxID=1670830 RepID=A0A8J3AC20_9ACTN|nr:class I SAM-dependent methyltransferase [Egicoccus halophilus]GGI08180.1 SAM-dependent methyltransferase [Egicoccus halophilus]